jgi:hypothetical protein
LFYTTRPYKDKLKRERKALILNLVEVTVPCGNVNVQIPPSGKPIMIKDTNTLERARYKKISKYQLIFQYDQIL